MAGCASEGFKRRSGMLDAPRPDPTWASKVCHQHLAMGLVPGVDPPRPSISRPNLPGNELYHPCPGTPGMTPGVGIIGVIMPIPMPMGPIIPMPGMPIMPIPNGGNMLVESYDHRISR